MYLNHARRNEPRYIDFQKVKKNKLIYPDRSKFAGLHTHRICWFYGRNGHLQYECEKKRTFDKKTAVHVSILLNKIEDNLKECLSTMKKLRLTMLLLPETLMALINLVLFRKMYVSTIHCPDKLSLSGFVKTNLLLQAEVKMKSNKTWFIGSSCSEHMTGEMTDFISLQKQNGGKISFGKETLV